MKIYRRTDWKARHANGRGRAHTPAARVWLHHTAGKAGKASATVAEDMQLVRDLEAVGQARFGSGISYTFVVTRSGRVFEGHSYDRVGTHTAKENLAGRSICLPGNYDQIQPTVRQLEAVVLLLQHGKQQGWWDSAQLAGGHRDAPGAATACPGAHLQAHIESINARAADADAQAAGMPLVGSPSATLSTAQAWATSKGADARFIDDILPALSHAAQQLQRANGGQGIDVAVVAAQAAKETGWGRFSGVLTPAFHNSAGIKTASGGSDSDPAAHESFTSWQEGARAHLNHLAAYVGLAPVGTPHGRYHVVTRLTWAGTVRTVEELGARWAPSGSYGQEIAALASELAAHEPAAIATPAAPQARRPTLRRGSRGPDVQHLQKLLPGLTADGIYGLITERAVRSFQEAARLQVDGIAGPQTWAALEAVTPAIHAASLPTVRSGDRGPAVSQLQNLLATRGLLAHNLQTGVFGPRTLAAVLTYQQQARLTVDGIVGPQTWRSLLGRPR